MEHFFIILANFRSTSFPIFRRNSPQYYTQRHAIPFYVIFPGNSFPTFSRSVRVDNDFDYESIAATERAHKRRFADFARQMRRLCPGCLPLTAGSCTLCARCTYPDRPCRYPTKRLSSMEAYGLFVSDICARSGLAYNYGPRTMTYTSCVLYNKE